MDLTHNNLNAQDIEIVGEGLKVNHTILGIHLMGNEAELDG